MFDIRYLSFLNTFVGPLVCVEWRKWNGAATLNTCN